MTSLTLNSYAAGNWIAPQGQLTPLRSAIDGKTVAQLGRYDLDFAAHLNPPLTTMQVPAVEMGAQAGRFLMDTLEGKSPLDRVELEARLIIRGTTGPPAAPGIRSF